jgi:hypothetical protein
MSRYDRKAGRIQLRCGEEREIKMKNNVTKGEVS